MKTIKVYPQPYQFKEAALFVIDHVKSGDTLEMHYEASPPWISATVVDPAVIVAELNRLGVRHTVS